MFSALFDLIERRAAGSGVSIVSHLHFLPGSSAILGEPVWLRAAAINRLAASGSPFC